MAENENTSFDFGSQYDTGSEFTLVDEGEYEAVITKIEHKQTKSNGKRYLNVTFEIRRDVEQEFKGRKLFFSIFPMDDAPDHPLYNFQTVNRIISTQEGLGTWDPNRKFQSADEVFQYMVGLKMIVKVVTSAGNDGVERNSIDKFKFKKTEHEKNGVIATSGKPEVKSGNLGDIAVTDDELPF